MSFAYKLAIKVINFTDSSDAFMNFSQPGLGVLVKSLISYI